MEKFMVTAAGMLILVMTLLVVPAADAEQQSEVSVEFPAVLSEAQIKELLVSEEGNTDTIWSIDGSRVALESDISFLLTDKTRYYAANGDRLTRLNFHKGTKIKYFLRSDVFMGVLRNDMFMGVMIKLP